MAIHYYNMSLDSHEYSLTCPLWWSPLLEVKPLGTVSIRKYVLDLFSLLQFLQFIPSFSLLIVHTNVNEYFANLYYSGTLKYNPLEDYVHIFDFFLFFFSP